VFKLLNHSIPSLCYCHWWSQRRSF